MTSIDQLAIFAALAKASGVLLASDSMRADAPLARAVTFVKIAGQDSLHILQHRLVERQIGNESFQARVFVPQLVDLADLGGTELTVLPFPEMNRIFVNAGLRASSAIDTPASRRRRTAPIDSGE